MSFDTVVQPELGIKISRRAFGMQPPDERDVPKNRAWRRATSVKSLPPMVPLLEAAGRIEALMNGYLNRFHDRIRIIENQEIDRDNRFADGKDPGPKPKTPPHVPPLGVASTPGSGKSEAAKKVMQEAVRIGVPVLLVCHDHAALDAYEKFRDGTPTGIFHMRGRRKLDKKGPEPWTCREHGKTTMLAEQYHWAAQNLCRDKCGFGQAWKALQGDEKAAEAREWFAKNKKDMSDYTACEWQALNAAARASLVVGITWQSYSEAMSKYYPPGEKYRLERLIIIDEEVPLGSPVTIGLPEISDWRRNCDDEISRLSAIEFKTTEKANDAARQIAGLKEGTKMLCALGETLGEMTSTGKADSIQHVPDQLRETMRTLKRRTAGLWGSGTAGWEKVRFTGLDIDDRNVPKRATAAIITTLAGNSGYFKNGLLHVYALTGIGEDIVKGRSAIILDATMPRVVQQIITANGGNVEKIIVKQNATIIRYPNHLLPRGTSEPDPEKEKSEKQKAHETLSLKRALQTFDLLHTDKPSLLITSMNFLEPLYDEQKLNPDKCQIASLAILKREIGYFGNHDKARNDYVGYNMVAFGGPLLSTPDQRKGYNLARMTALLAGIDKDEWPAWVDDNDIVRDVWIDEGSGYEIKCLARLPKDPFMRRWVLDNYAGKALQRLGRGRAVWAPIDAPLVCLDFGGLPVDWYQYGVIIAEYRDDELGWKTGPETQHSNARSRFDDAVARIDSRGAIPSKSKIVEEMAAMKSEGLIAMCVSPRLAGAWWAEIKAERQAIVESDSEC